MWNGTNYPNYQLFTNYLFCVFDKTSAVWYILMLYIKYGNYVLYASFTNFRILTICTCRVLLFF